MIDLWGEDGAVLPRMAPDLLYLSSKPSTDTADNSVTLTSTTSLVTALQLTGKWSISRMHLWVQANSGTVTVRLTIDGDVIWDTSVTNISNQVIAMLGSTSSSWATETYMCNSSLKLEVMHSIANTTMALRYLARPIK